MTILPRTARAFALDTVAVLVGSLCLGGCNGAFVGNIVVLFVSVGIFFGTLNLGRFTRPASGTSPAEQSQRDR